MRSSRPSIGPATAALVAALVAAGCGDAGREQPPDTSPPPPPSAQPPADRPPPPAATRCPRGAPAGRGVETRTLVGLREDAARAAAERGGCTLRVIERDGEPLAYTQEYRDDRVNVRVRAGVVVAIDGIG